MTMIRTLDALPTRRGHFVLESGYHTDRWIALDALFVDPAAIAPQVAVLGERLRAHAPTAICGPLLGGAFLAQALAMQLGLRFFAAEPAPDAPGTELYRARYRLPPGQQPRVRGERIAVVDDAISAGSSVRAAIEALAEAGGTIAAVGALIVFGDTAVTHFAERRIPLETLERRTITLWPPTECELCRAGTPLDCP